VGGRTTNGSCALRGMRTTDQTNRSSFYVSEYTFILEGVSVNATKMPRIFSSSNVLLPRTALFPAKRLTNKSKGAINDLNRSFVSTEVSFLKVGHPVGQTWELLFFVYCFSLKKCLRPLGCWAQSLTISKLSKKESFCNLQVEHFFQYFQYLFFNSFSLFLPEHWLQLIAIQFKYGQEAGKKRGVRHRLRSMIHSNRNTLALSKNGD